VWWPGHPSPRARLRSIVNFREGEKSQAGMLIGVGPGLGVLPRTLYMRSSPCYAIRSSATEYPAPTGPCTPSWEPPVAGWALPLWLLLDRLMRSRDLLIAEYNYLVTLRYCEYTGCESTRKRKQRTRKRSLHRPKCAATVQRCRCTLNSRQLYPSDAIPVQHGT
jgi:hypothetical protein